MTRHSEHQPIHRKLVFGMLKQAGLGRNGVESRGRAGPNLHDLWRDGALFANHRVVLVLRVVGIPELAVRPELEL